MNVKVWRQEDVDLELWEMIHRRNGANSLAKFQVTNRRVAPSNFFMHVRFGKWRTPIDLIFRFAR